jgi:uncharacterized protein
VTPPGDDEAGSVRDNAPARRYEIELGGPPAVLAYRRTPGAIELLHTEVPPAHRGRGLAEQLARHALDAARREGLRVVPTCPFVQAYLRRHPEDQALTAGRTAGPTD